MMRRVCFVAGLTILALVWLGPLPRWAGPSFSAHMLMHLGVLAAASPLLALGLASRHARPLSPAVPLLASALELVVVSLWHVPVLHDAARSDGLMMLLEQASFLGCGLLLWSSALQRPDGTQAGGNLAMAGVAALLVSSMHMTLLGALIALSPRELYRCEPPLAGMLPIADQQLGGALMLIATSAIYLAAGLFQLRRILNRVNDRWRPRHQVNSNARR
ncbi:MAG: hypothetical protein CTY25_04430 [Methylobacterium sp.]|nr:MAG: hypothetical protein CTY25_04430 [Methylobacterium sp.]